MKRRFVLVGLGVMALTLGISYASMNDSSATKAARFEKSDQFSDGAFRNPGANIDFSLGSTARSLWSFVFEKRDTKPEFELPKQPVDLAYFGDRHPGQLRAAWLGHSSLLINIDGLVVITDPALEKSVSFFGPTRYNGEAPLTAEDLPGIDVALISHDHYDHLNRHTIERIYQKTSLFITPLGVGDYLRDWGVPEEKIVQLDWWEAVTVGRDHVVTCTPAQHFSGRGVTDRNKTLWSSFVVKSPTRSFFFGGDSGYFDGFKTIGRKHGPFDMTFLECGAYNERWAAIHMMPEETVQAHVDLNGRILHPIHWGTFDLAMHPWYEPMSRLAAAADSAGVITATPIVGEATVVGVSVPQQRWWEERPANTTEASAGSAG